MGVGRQCGTVGGTVGVVGKDGGVDGAVYITAEGSTAGAGWFFFAHVYNHKGRLVSAKQWNEQRNYTIKNIHILVNCPHNRIQFLTHQSVFPNFYYC